MYVLSPSNIQVDNIMYYWHSVNDLYIKDLSNFPMYYEAGILQKKILLKNYLLFFWMLRIPSIFKDIIIFSSHLLRTQS